MLPGGAAPAAPPIAQTAAVSSRGLQILALRAGAEPYPWLIPGRIAKSFVTNSPESLELVAFARLKGHPEADSRIKWTVSPPAGFELPRDATLTGAALSVRLVRRDGNPTGRGKSLSLSVTARIEGDGEVHERTAELAQDLRDRLRQEYVDLRRTTVPARSDLLDEDEFARRFRKKYPGVTFAELNWSRIPGDDERYPLVLATEELVRTLHKAEREYGAPLVISSGYRNPVRQTEVHGSVAESHHQYGRAADLYVAPDSASPKTGRKIATPEDWLRLAAASLRAGGIWIEPMLDCHVNTDGCHVHVDVRESGARSRLARISGRVVEPSGNAVPQAMVRLAGMTAATNALGIFSLKHVISGDGAALEIEAPGRPPVSHRVSLSTESAAAVVMVPADPQPSVVARASSTERGADGNLRLMLSLRNIGLTEARMVRLASRGGTALSLNPAHVDALAPGQEASVQLDVAGAGGGNSGQAPPSVELTASFRTPGGAVRTQSLSVTPPLEVPGVQSPSAAPVRPAAQPQTNGSGAGPANHPLTAAGGAFAAGAAAAAVGAAARRVARPAGPRGGEASVDPAAGAPDPPSATDMKH